MVEFRMHCLSTAVVILLHARVYSCCSAEIGCEVTENKLTCANTFNISALEHNEIDTVEICGLNKSTFYINNIFDIIPNVSVIIVKQSSIKRIKGNIPKSNNIKVIRFNNLSITEMDEDFFKNAKNLEILDLRNNSLKHLHKHRITSLQNISEILLLGNKWNCSSHLNWVLELNKTTAVKDLHKLKCFKDPYPEKHLIRVARFLHEVHTNCPSICVCTLANVVRYPDTDILQPIVDVNCSDKQLVELPPHLPKHTITLRLERNFISDLIPLLENDIYKDVQDLYLDHNFITNIEILEGSYWLSHFRVLSLNGNKLTELPTYAIDNALRHNPNMPNAVMIYLGNNPWRCDCVFTPSFQENLLAKYHTQIQDLPDIKCSYVQGDENSMSPIIQLSRGSVCRLPNEYSVKALDLLNGILASLIILVLGKLAYDYYYFKRTGKLPWIVTKIP